MRRPKVFLVMAVLSALSAAIIVFSALRQRERQIQTELAERVNIAVAARDISLGEKIAVDAVKLAQWSRDAVPPGSFTDKMAPVGSYANDDFVAGEPIVQKKLLTAQQAPAVMQLMIPRGMRAMSVAVDEVGDIAGFVKPHSRVDVLVALSSGPDSKSFSKIVLQDVEVLAIAQQLERSKDEAEVAKVVTLLVTPHQAEKLGIAQREGSVRLAMRNYLDTRVIETAGSDLSELLGLPGSAGAPVMKAQGAGTTVESAARAPRRSGPPPYRIRIMRDGKKFETLSFIAAPAQSHKGRPVEELVPEPQATPAPFAIPKPMAMQTPASALAPSHPVSASLGAVPKNIELP